MRTTFEEGTPEDDTPMPGKVIEAFRRSHAQLVQSALALHVAPSAEALAQFNTFADTALENIKPFYALNFFNGADTVIPIRESVIAVTQATKDIAEKTLVINPDWMAVAEFSDETLEEIIEQLAGPDQEEYISHSAILCNNYFALVANMKDGVFASPNVARFLRNQARKEELKKHAINVGVTALGTYIGILLAQRTRK